MDNDLLRRYFENSISFQEKEIVDQWITDRENEAFLLQFIEKSYLEEKEETPAATFDKVFEEIQRRNSHPAKIISLGKRKWLWRAAAACILFLLSGALIGYFLSGHKVHENYGDVWLMNNTSTSSGQYAQLVLDDGSEIYLGENSGISFSSKTAIHPVVYLEGQAYFNLKNGGKTLTVKTKDLITVANNSKFNITSFKKDSTETVSVEKGKAEISENREVFPMMKLRFPQKDSVREDSLNKTRKVIPWTNIKPALKVRENEQVTFDRNTNTTDVKEVPLKVIPLIDLIPAHQK